MNEEDGAILEVAGIDLKDYKELGLKQLSKIIRRLDKADSRQVSAYKAGKAIINWNEKFDISDQEYAEYAYQYWKSGGYNSTADEKYAALFTNKGKWVWNN